ncbi:MAG: J domain-containing protein [Thermoplasmata archaeon]|nr:MAG: J domain-containing protein [Thermoplasmata archaeon]
MVQDHYQILGVSRNATQQEIKRAFRSHAIRYHPDVTRLDKAKAEDWFKLISKAYWVLKDPKRRMEYNRTLPAPKEVKVIYDEPPPWERQKDEEWIWDERQLRYRRKETDDDGMYEARSPFSFLERDEIYHPKTEYDRLKESVFAPVQSFRFWIVRRARITRLRYRLFLDWINKRRLYTRHPKRSKKSKAKST